MKSRAYKYSRIALFVCIFVYATLLTGCGNDHRHNDQNAMGKQEEKIDSSIIQTGVIDLEMIDENNDGMVFQDPMDWNVISDKAGKCPLCKMTLEEVAIKEAKENLLKNGFKVK